MRQPRDAERRWIILGEDGRYVTLGRATDPTAEEIQASEEGLRAQGLAGWVAVMEGNPYVGRMPVLLQVRALGSPTGEFSDASRMLLANIKAQREEYE